MFKTFLFLVRLAALIYFFFVILPDFYNVLKETSQLHAKNWWNSEEEDFVTNISPFNAIICWIFYIFFAFLLFFVIYMYVPVVIVANIITLMREPPSTRHAIRYQCIHYVAPFFGKLFMSILRGTALDRRRSSRDPNQPVDTEEFMNLADVRRREQFYQQNSIIFGDKNKKRWGVREIDARECPICLETFIQQE